MMDGYMLKNLKLLGEGRTASVYAIDERKAVKLFHEGYSKEQVKQVFDIYIESENACIPVIKVYETVSIAGRFGFSMDRMEGGAFESQLAGASTLNERMELVDSFSYAAKSIHKTDVGSSKLRDQKEFALSAVEKLPAADFTKDEEKTIRNIVEEVPYGSGYVHGDLHTGNAFMLDGNFLFADLGSFTGKGHYLWDLCCMYSHYVFFPSIMDDCSVKKYIGMDQEAGKQVYDEFIRAYFNNKVPDIKQMIKRIQAAKVCLAYALLPGVFSAKIIEAVKRNLL